MAFTAADVERSLFEKFGDVYYSVGSALSEEADLPDGFEYVSAWDRSTLNPSIIWSVIRHVESDRLFGIYGWYSSWDSPEWEEFVEVEKTAHIVYDYKEKK